MNPNKTFKLLLSVLIFFGCCSIVYAIVHLPYEKLDWKSSLLIVLTLLISTRLTLSLPRSQFHLSFSDTVIFLSFLLFGGEVAILLATLEVFINCLYLKFIKHYPLTFTGIAFNISNTIVSVAVTYIMWLVLPTFGFPHLYQTATNLISTLAVLALVHFTALSVFASFYYSLLKNLDLWKSWKEIGFPSSMTQIAGAGLAGVIYKLLSFADVFTITISFFVFVIAYLNYRQMIKNINQSIEQAETAEREKADIAEQKAKEMEAHAEQLEILLKKEEKISEDLRQSKNDLEYAAFHDNLTELPNRAYLIERLDLLLQMGMEVSSKYYVLFLDLSRFKNINDSLGHTIGDEVLRVVAKRLKSCLREEDTIARLGGDEFAIILNDLETLEDAMNFANQIYTKLTEPYKIQGNKIHSDLNIGIAPLNNEQTKPEDILRDADIAMHSAKERNLGVAIFDKEIRSKYLEYIKLEDDLRYAVEKQEFEMNYQPLISLKDGELMGFEALIRWHHSQLGLISPVKFIPISEDSGLIIPITKWILQETCVQIAKWQKISPDYKNLLVSVNISGKHLTEESLIEDVKNALAFSGLNPNSLKLEITETTAMKDAERTIEILNQLKQLGVHLSIDDFGTGYSSLNYLHRIPFDTLKIDRSFVWMADGINNDSQILETIVALTKNLKKATIAEGIETEAQLKFLQSIGCDYGQGYLFCKPQQKDDMETMLYKKTKWLPETTETIDETTPTENISEPDNLHIF